MAASLSFPDRYNIKNESESFRDFKVTCPLNLHEDINNICYRCGRCFNGETLTIEAKERIMDQELIQAYKDAKYVIELKENKPKKPFLEEAYDPIESTQPSDYKQYSKTQNTSDYDLEFARAMRVKLKMNRQLRVKAAAEKEETSIEIRVGSTYPTLDYLMKEAQCNLAVFITPENPRSESLTELENASRHDEFLSIINSEHLTYFNGYGCDDEELYGREDSYLLFLNEKKFADNLANQFGQNGYLLIRQNEPIKLLLNNDSSYIEFSE